MKDWEKVLVGPRATLREALIKIDAAGSQMALVVDEERRLLGTLSDGDVRRGLIKGLNLSDRVEQAMFATPRTVQSGEGRDEIRSLLKRLGVHHIPVLDAERRVIGLELVDDFFVPAKRDNWVVLMAGGLGSRLKELTQSVPKPMLAVGDRPILETIIRSYIDQGFRHFFIAVNYKAELIESHFGDGSKFGVRIEYLREDKRMGTAGALSMLPGKPTLPVLVSNGDLLVKLDHAEMLESHVACNAVATMAVREYEFQIPYGVVRETDGAIHRIEEKPVHRALVAAGMYVLSPEALEFVPHGQFFDMPALFGAVIGRGLSTRCHPVRGYWVDVGRMADYQKANEDFREVFE
jgi:dTDP-glucose pyrophosphorylase